MNKAFRSFSFVLSSITRRWPPIGVPTCFPPKSPAQPGWLTAHVSHCSAKEEEPHLCDQKQQSAYSGYFIALSEKRPGGLTLATIKGD